MLIPNNPVPTRFIPMLVAGVMWIAGGPSLLAEDRPADAMSTAGSAFADTFSDGQLTLELHGSSGRLTGTITLN